MITLILLLAFHLIPIIPCYTGLTDGRPDGREPGVWKLCSLGGPLSLWMSRGHYYDYFGLQNGEILSLLYALIISYLIACTLMLIKKE